MSKAGYKIFDADCHVSEPPEAIDAYVDSAYKGALDELKLPFPVLADRFAILARRYRADALPYVVLVDAAGKIRWSHAGYDPAGLKEVLAKLP